MNRFSLLALVRNDPDFGRREARTDGCAVPATRAHCCRPLGPVRAVWLGVSLGGWICILLGILAGAGVVRAGDAFRVVRAEPAPDLGALYVRTNGWVGADGNYSVPVGVDRTVFFFGDSFVGGIVGDRRTNVVMINNSLGLLSGRGDRARMEFFWGSSTNGSPAAFFRPPSPRGYFWPFAGAMASGRLHLFLFRMENTGEGGAFGFRNVDVWLGTVANPMDSPGDWRVDFRVLPFTELGKARQLLFGAAVLSHGGVLYIYGTEDRPQEAGFGRRMILARVAQDAVSDFGHWRFFSGGEWVDDFRKATAVAPGMASEYSVSWVGSLGAFLAVGNDAFLSPDVMARSASQPWGPWSDPVLLFRCPDVKWNTRIFCYAGKAHAALSGSDELVVSYAANSSEFADLIRDTRLYWPKLVRVKVAPVGNGAVGAP